MPRRPALLQPASAVIMIGALQVVLEECTGTAIFILTPARPLPLSSPGTTRPRTVRHSHRCTDRSACYNQVFERPLLGICPAAQPAILHGQPGSLVGEEKMGRRRTHENQPLNSNSGAADDSPSVVFTWKREPRGGRRQTQISDERGTGPGFGFWTAASAALLCACHLVERVSPLSRGVWLQWLIHYTCTCAAYANVTARNIRIE